MQERWQKYSNCCPYWHILSLKDIGFTDLIPEPFHTFEENAAAKARAVFNFCHKPVLADDSGLCVPSLQNEPGVDSAHYAGPQRSDADNTAKLLHELAGKPREAYYVALLFYINAAGKEVFFRGTCDGQIAPQPQGEGGFGYDPVFIPAGFYKHIR